MTQTNRVHQLRYQGAPHSEDGSPLNDPPTKTKGPGRAVCRCGELSPELPNGAARREWYDLHRDVNPVPRDKVNVTSKTTEQGETLHQVVLYLPETISKHFWVTLGKEAAVRIVEGRHPSVTVETRSENRQVTLTSKFRSTVTRAADDLLQFWSTVDKAAPEWRELAGNDVPEPKSVWERRQVSRELRDRFYRGLTEMYVKGELR